ncbi:MAG TPA: 1,2-phenylacetyl-CoA epoxidase subunit PaaE [Casimicrobiaceae bacterium]
MSRFHRLPVARVDRETRDAVAITFAVPDALREEFRWQAGQHLTLRAAVGGDDLRRSYSICSAAHDDELRVAIKRSPGGTFSNHANDVIRAGDTLDVMPPMGHFGVPCDASVARHFVAFAAGSGITPILSIVKTTLAVEEKSRFTLIYGNRASSSVMFREELAALKDEYLTRFNLVHVLSRETQDIELLNGRIDRAKAEALLARWVGNAAIDAYYVCGPDGMMQAVADALAARGVAAERIRIERFASSIPLHTHVPRAVPVAGRRECEVTAIIDGARRTFILQKGEQNIIDGGLANGVDLPYSCKGGVCSTCRCRLIEGEVDMDVNFALEDYEVARGFRLACQSYPASDRVVVDFDQTGTGVA